MTALRDWDTVDPRHTDAELVRGSMAGDRAAFAQIYDRYADRLHDFCVGMLRDLDGAADCVQETFCLAATRLPQLRDPDKLRPWLYSIARNEALRRLRERRRETPSDELPDVVSDDAGPDTLSARSELADLVAEVAGGLSDRDRAVLDLAFRHGLEGPELADALGVSQGNANTMVHRLRQTVERSLGALLVSRRARSTPDACAELREMVAAWDGHFTVLMRKRISRHIESCPVCEEERRRLVSPAALLGATPVFIPAPQWLREKTLGDIQLVSHDSAMENESDDSLGARPDPASTAPHTYNAGRSRRRILLAALLIAILTGSAGLVLAWVNKWQMPFTQTEVIQTEPESVPPPLAPAQTPGPVTPRSKVPPPVPPPLVQTPVSEPTPQTLPSTPPRLVDPAPPAEEPVEEPSIPAPPSSKPPMSFSPTVVVPPQDPGSGGVGDGPDRPVGAGGP